MRRGLLVALNIFLVVCALSTCAGAAGRRVALVVGVSKYEHAAVLTNTVNDANDMTAALKRAGFDVELLIDPNRAALEAAIRRYGDRSVGAELSLFHYSGHAIEAGGRNWILPVTANLNSERDLRFEAIDLSTILEQTDGAAQVSIVFLDACRDNPFAGRIAAARRDVVSRGLGRVDIAATGMLVAFAAAPGQVASDGDGKNSPFTASLISHIATPGLEIKTLLARVTKDVVEKTKGKQRPWQNSSLEADVYLIAPPDKPAAPTAQSSVNLEGIFWDSIKTSRDPADFKAYLAQFPKGVFVELARNRLAMLEQRTTVTPPQSTGPPQAAPSEAMPRNSTTNPAVPSVSAFHAALVAQFHGFAVAAEEAEARAHSYETAGEHKAMAVAVQGRHTWRSVRWPTDEAATTATLEGCQIYYGEPCTLVAVGHQLEPASGSAAVIRDMARTRYSGRLDPERIPAVNSELRRRPDVASYRTATGAKAAAYHPWGRLFIVTNAPGQFEAEEQALARCNNDPDRKGHDGPCYLYAAGDRVVLPQRLAKPRPQPQTISEAFAYLGVPGYSYAYGNDKAHKAIAFAPESGQTFRWTGSSSLPIAEERALEGCQLQYRTTCVLLASDDVLHAPDAWKAARRDMPRLHYDGPYKPENVPLFSGTPSELQSYGSLPAPKAMVIRPNRGRLRTATGVTPQEAQAKALAACNDDDDAMPCFVYAVNDRVLLGQRLTEPMK
jgi:hypothetical protein